MIVWTIQTTEVWERVQTEGVLLVDEDIVERDFVDRLPLSPYKWLAGEMERRIPHHKASLPWWGWHRWRGVACPRPDLRTVSALHPKGERAVRIELEARYSDVLLSDYNSWHAVLNGHYLSFSETEFDEFGRKLEEAGVGWMDQMATEPFRSLIIRSWQRVFNITGGDPYWCGAPEERSIQATFWELRLDQVRHAQVFTGRGKNREYHPCACTAAEIVYWGQSQGIWPFSYAWGLRE